MLLKRTCSILLIELGIITCPLSLGTLSKDIDINSMKQKTLTVSQKAEEVKDYEQRKSAIVYITKSGKCYHQKGCKHLKKSSISIDITDAINNNYSPCKICNLNCLCNKMKKSQTN